MLSDHHLVYLLLALTLVGFMWGRIRYDLVALMALIGAVIVGVVPADGAFAGFGHPAVITVAAVLVLSRGFLQSGLVDLIAGQTLKVGSNVTVQIVTLTGVVAVMSAFMNNVGALALMLPVAMRMARENGNPPSLLLMPLAFGSLLGGADDTDRNAAEHNYFIIPGGRCWPGVWDVFVSAGGRDRDAGRITFSEPDRMETGTEA